MHEAMIEVLGVENIAFVRLRRDRYGTTRSQNATKGLVLVLSNNPNAVLSVTQEQWESMTQHQRYLWAIDELEARWQRLLINYPKVHALEINWEEFIPEDGIRVLRDILQCPSNDASIVHKHWHNVDRGHDATERESDVEYKNILKLSEKERRMITMVQF